MRRTMLNFLIDAATFLAALGMVATGLIVRWVLPPGSGQRRTLWTMTRHEWGDVHFWLAVVLVVLAIVHIALHWNWVCTVVCRCFGMRRLPVTRRDRIRQNVMGVAILAVLFGAMGVFVWFARGNVVETPRERGNVEASESVAGRILL